MNISSIILPPIEDILLHRGTMLLLDRVLSFDDESVAAEAIPCDKRWYCNDAGKMSAWIGIELMAQTVAVHVAMKKKRENLPAKMGVLLGTRHYHSTVADFLPGELLCIKAHLIVFDANGLGVYDCSIARDEDIIATATLKVYEPDDFGLFMQGNTP